MKKYPKMKPSGVEWVGEVPEGWEVKKLKYFAEIKLGKMLTPDDKGDYSLKPYLRAQNLQWFKPDLNDVKEMWFSEKELEMYRVEKNDLLVSEGGEVGRTCIWNDEIREVYIQNSVNKVTIQEGDSAKFFLYCFTSSAGRGYFDAIVNRVSIAHLTKEKLKEVEFPYPHSTEQTTIAAYLDRKTAQIDQSIIEKQGLIELFREERQAIINHAVTKGIRPGVKMKDSGVEWIGEVPEGWVVKKNGYLCEIKRGSGYQYITEVFDNENCEAVIRISDFNNFNPILATKIDAFDKYRVFKNDILIAGTGASAGITLFVNDEMEGMVHSYNALRLKVFGINPKLLFYEFNSHFIFEQMNLSFTGSAQHFLDVEGIANFQISVPPMDEQVKIVAYLDQKTAQIDTAILGIQQEIALLQEYRQALIFEAVTGKVCVI